MREQHVLIQFVTAAGCGLLVLDKVGMGCDATKFNLVQYAYVICTWRELLVAVIIRPLPPGHEETLL